jgi:hypothetical protein
MALINLQTNLKSLKYGKDKVFGGDSNQPYVTTNIPSNNDGISFETIISQGPEGVVRGGLLAPIRAAKDVERISKWFTDTSSPRGLIFTINQNLLSRSGVKTEATFGLGYGGGIVNEGIYNPASTLAQIAVEGWTGTHLNKQGLNPFKSTGAYTDSGLLNQIFDTGGINLYNDVVKNNNLEENNQFPILNKTITLQSPKPFTDKFGIELPSILPVTTYSLTGGYKNRLLDIWYNKQLGTDDSNNIRSYGGGPGSILGIGQTNIRFSDQRTGERNINFNKSYFKGKGNRSYTNSPETTNILSKLGASLAYSGSFGKFINTGFDSNGNQTPDNPFGFRQSPSNQTLSTFTPSDFKINVLTQSQINDKTPNIKFIKFSPVPLLPTIVKNNPIILVDDFRTELDIEKNNTILSFSPNYKENNIEKRVNLGDPGSRTKNRSDYTLGGLNGFNRDNNIKNALDKITSSPIYEATFKRNDYPGGDPGTLNDLATFYIAAYKNDTSSNAFYMHFRAFINSFSDSYSPKWNSINYVGRGDTLYNYEGFTRDVKVSFTVAAQSKQELMPMYYKLNYLASTLAPDYTGAGFMRGTLYKMTLGAYLFETPGIITSLNYTIPEQSPWEININNSSSGSIIDNSVKELPHIINVDLGFTPIHNFLPRRATDRSGAESPFISLRNGNGGNADGYNHYDNYISGRNS